MIAYFTVTDVATQYGVTAHVVLGWIARSELRAVNVAASAGSKRPTWRIAEDALRDFERLRSPHPTLPKARTRMKTGKGMVSFY